MCATRLSASYCLVIRFNLTYDIDRNSLVDPCFSIGIRKGIDIEEIIARSDNFNDNDSLEEEFFNRIVGSSDYFLWELIIKIRVYPKIDGKQEKIKKINTWN